MWAVRVAWQSRSFDAILLNCAVSEALFLCAALRVLASRCALVVSDPVMNPPRGSFGSMRAQLKRWLLKRVNLFVVHQRDLGEYSRLYGITSGRSNYVPFKVNLLDTIRTLAPRDGDYVFSCGVTNRDWATLGAATRDARYRVIVSMPDSAQLKRMGATATPPHRGDFGPNAVFVENGSDPREWLELAAGARIVVLPVTADAINPSGVSTYLSIMALGKCVIISDGPATRGIVSEQAVVVPPGDAARLRDTIERVWDDDTRIRETARRGREYAESLGDSKRLLKDLSTQIVELLKLRGRDASIATSGRDSPRGATLHP